MCSFQAAIQRLGGTVVSLTKDSSSVMKGESLEGKEKGLVYIIQYKLSILDTLGPNNTVLIMKVSLFERFINTHLYCIGTDTTCPDYIEVPLV